MVFAIGVGDWGIRNAISGEPIVWQTYLKAINYCKLNSLDLDGGYYVIIPIIANWNKDTVETHKCSEKVIDSGARELQPGNYKIAKIALDKVFSWENIRV